MMNEPALINAQHLTLIRGVRCLFKDLSFRLGAGQAMHLIGENGSGKTSLFKVVMGLLKPTRGTLEVLGESATRLEPATRAQMLYLGHANPIKTQLTVLENLRLNAEVFDNMQPSAKALEHALEQVGLWAFRDQRAGQLSAGQKRRVSLARLWLLCTQEGTRKPLWLLDEPLTALDADFVERLQEHLVLHLSHGGAVLFTSHQRLSLQTEVASLKLGDFSLKAVETESNAYAVAPAEAGSSAPTKTQPEAAAPEAAAPAEEGGA